MSSEFLEKYDVDTLLYQEYQNEEIYVVSLLLDDIQHRALAE